MRHTFIALLSLVTLAGTTPAWATATLFCEASLKQLDLSIIAIVPYDQGSPLLQVRGDLTPRPEGVVPAPAEFELNDANNTQYWLDDSALDLRFYTESETDGLRSSALLTIKTKVRADDLSYFDGELEFEGYWGLPDGSGDPTELKLDGKVTCSVG